MTFHLGGSRRQFLRTTLVGGAAWSAGLLSLRLEAAEGEATRLALLSDTHIAADEKAVLRETNMADNLRRVWKQVLAAQPFSAAIVHGDLALLKGEAGDYATLTKLLLPEGKPALPLSLLLGNHDDREQFRKGMRSSADSPLESHHVTILETPHANWYTLDSLDKVNVAPGAVGQSQLDWLAAALDAHADRPAVISVHHNPQFMPGKDGKIGGLTDTQELFAVLKPRKQVKAVVFGHSHDWKVGEHAGIHLINLPPTAYVFAAGRPNGWVEAAVAKDSITLKLHTLEEKHPLQAETKTLAWR